MKNSKFTIIEISVVLFVLETFIFLLLKPKKEGLPSVLSYNLNKSETTVKKNIITNYFFDKKTQEKKTVMIFRHLIQNIGLHLQIRSFWSFLKLLVAQKNKKNLLKTIRLYIEVNEVEF